MNKCLLINNISQNLLFLKEELLSVAYYIVIILVIGAITYLYTVKIRKNISDSTKGWWDNWTSTFISVLFAIIVGMALFEYGEYRTRNNKKISYRNLLQNEFLNIDEILSSERGMTIKIGNNEYFVLMSYIEPIIIEEAVRSDLYEDDITKEMISLARHIRVFTKKSDILLRKIAIGKAVNENPENFEENIKSAINDIEKTRSTIIALIKELNEMLEMELQLSK